MSIEECFGILELKPGASLAEVKTSWRVLCQIWHPDKHAPGSKAYSLAEERQLRINQAYGQLKQHLGNDLQPGVRMKMSEPFPGRVEQSARKTHFAEAPDPRSHVRFLVNSFARDFNSVTAGELALWSERAKSGDPKAQLFLGMASELGLGGWPVDCASAAWWYERASEKGSAAAMHRLGYLYLYGKGVEKNPQQGIRLWKYAALRGNRDAQMDLGMAFENGAWVTSSKSEARRWYAMAADNGDPVAKQKLRELPVPPADKRRR